MIVRERVTSCLRFYLELLRNKSNGAPFPRACTLSKLHLRPGIADPTMVTYVSAIRSIKHEGCEGACHARRVRFLSGLRGFPFWPNINQPPRWLHGRYHFFFRACFAHWRRVQWIYKWYLILKRNIRRRREECRMYHVKYCSCVNDLLVPQQANAYTCENKNTQKWKVSRIKNTQNIFLLMLLCVFVLTHSSKCIRFSVSYILLYSRP